MFDRILVPLDGSHRSEVILPHVARFLGAREPELILLRVQERFLTPEHEKHDTSWYDWSTDLIQKNLWSLEGKLRERGLNARSLLRQGKPAELILEVADELDASVIAMCTHGYGGAERWAFGSVADKVVRHSSRPLLLSRGEGDAQSGGDLLAGGTAPVQQILVPLDCDLPARPVTRLAGEVALRHGAQVTLFHVREPIHWLRGTSAAAVPAETGEFLGEEREYLEGQGVRVRYGHSSGSPADEILNEVRSQRHDLIAMSTHGRHGFSRWLYGNVADLVMRTAGVPSLIVPQGEE